jgi:hypothetical protein
MRTEPFDQFVKKEMAFKDPRFLAVIRPIH